MMFTISTSLLPAEAVEAPTGFQAARDFARRHKLLVSTTVAVVVDERVTDLYRVDREPNALRPITYAMAFAGARRGSGEAVER